MASVENFIDEWYSAAPCIIAHTSGSTGAPKEIRLDKELVCRSAQRSIDFFGIGPGSRLHLCLSTDYIAGKMMVVRALLSGAELTVEPASNKVLSEPCLRSGRRISLLAVVPSQLGELVRHPGRLECVDNLLIGGGAIPVSLRKQIAVMPLQAWESYGMTETASHVALRKVVADDSVPFETLGDITCSLGDEGNLCLHRGEKRLATRDAAEVLSQRHFRLLGRLDNAIITGGVKVHPLEVERKLENTLRSLGFECAYYISSRPDSKWGDAVVLVLEGEYATPTLGKLQKVLNAVLTGAERPKEIICIPEFEYTRTGKLIRHTF